ncbi:DNA translocase FtsK [Lacticaseibacillus baoqingensis]|uniref:DNA translocase FtsK n=1 Tax=Lacticaseibacillus baoqingensis TaxID=2486013 RepID=A0ABW4E2J6_9LACO|nr:DNA translocase FtsK [Lacticaseibacillus baoqingensis]
MAHYDGPPFLRSEQPKAQPAAYPLPPKPQRHANHPSQPVTAKPQVPTKTSIGRHSVDPLAALATPKSVVHRPAKRAQIDYHILLNALMRPDDAVYLFTDEAPDAQTLDANATPPVLTQAPQPKPADAPNPQETATAKPDAKLKEAAPGPSPMPSVATTSKAASTPATAQTVTPDPAQDHPAAEVQTKPVAPSDQLPLLDPQQRAQQAKLQAALAKQKKTVYANWRPLQLPNSGQLKQAVTSYRQRPKTAKTLPQPIAERPKAQAQVPAQPAAKTPAANQPAAQPAAQPSERAAQPAVQPSEPVDQAQAAVLPYQLPPLDLLPEPVIEAAEAQDEWVVAQSERLDKTLTAFHVGAHVVAHTIGPTVTQFQVALAAGVKVNKITNLNDDLKLALAAKDIRIEAPIPGKTTVGIEIPNLKARPVMLREVLESAAFQTAASPLTIALGVDLFGQPVVTNLAKMPHGLIAGATGSGKSVFINSLLTSLLYKATPEEVRLLLIDPKAVELAAYNQLPHLVSPVISEPKAAAAALKWAVEEMEERYQKLAAAGVRNLEQFNAKAKDHGDYGMVMPYVVIIIDELADLMMVAASEVQDYIARITQKARAAGIHLIVATQRPSVDVITGTIKNNIPTRIAFMVASQTDSRTIIDANGAERLLGRGDMLYLGSGASQPIRLQGTFIDEDVATVVNFVKQERPPRYLFQPDGLLAEAEDAQAQDDLFPQVLEYIAAEKHVSTSKLQRVFSIGYNRAANLIDELEMRHYISPANGSKPRDVYLTKEDLSEN